MEQRRAELGLPEIVLDLTSVEALPPHLPAQISSFRFPHRNADAYLRDAMLDGTKFLTTEVGKAIFSATADKPEALLQWFPQAWPFGFWQSHLGRRSQAKLARAWTSEIIGVEPAATSVRRLGLKGDPLNLSVAEAVDFTSDAQEQWQFSAKGKKLADVGHGQVPVGGEDADLVAVSFREVVQQATVSFAALRRTARKRTAEARALLAGFGLVAHVAAFGRSFSLRSGAELRPWGGYLVLARRDRGAPARTAGPRRGDRALPGVRSQGGKSRAAGRPSMGRLTDGPGTGFEPGLGHPQDLAGQLMLAITLSLLHGTFHGGSADDTVPAADRLLLSGRRARPGCSPRWWPPRAPGTGASSRPARS